MKFEGVVPKAFEIAASSPLSPDKAVRLACRDIFRAQKTLGRLIPLIEEILAAGKSNSLNLLKMRSPLRFLNLFR